MFKRVAVLLSLGVLLAGCFDEGRVPSLATTMLIPTERSLVHVVYYVARDVSPAVYPEREARIRRHVRASQEVLAYEMERLGYGRKTFLPVTDAQGEVAFTWRVRLHGGYRRGGSAGTPHEVLGRLRWRTHS